MCTPSHSALESLANHYLAVANATAGKQEGRLSITLRWDPIVCSIGTIDFLELSAVSARPSTSEKRTPYTPCEEYTVHLY